MNNVPTTERPTFRQLVEQTASDARSAVEAATPTTSERVKGFMTIGVTMTLTASYHDSGPHGSPGKVFLRGWVPAEHGPYEVVAILLDVDQAKALIDELTVAVTR